MGYGWAFDEEEDQEPIGYTMGWPYYRDNNEPDLFINEISCIHEFVNVGFYTVSMACKKCGIDEII